MSVSITQWRTFPTYWRTYRDALSFLCKHLQTEFRNRYRYRYADSGGVSVFILCYSVMIRIQDETESRKSHTNKAGMAICDSNFMMLFIFFIAFFFLLLSFCAHPTSKQASNQSRLIPTTSSPIHKHSTQNTANSKNCRCKIIHKIFMLGLCAKRNITVNHKSHKSSLRVSFNFVYAWLLITVYYRGTAAVAAVTLIDSTEYQHRSNCLASSSSSSSYFRFLQFFLFVLFFFLLNH